MVKSILSSPQETILERAMSASALRHKVISNNIANVNTPLFKKSDVSFEDQLAEALAPAEPAMTRTHAKHLTGSKHSGGFEPVITTDTTTSLRTDDNNVDIDAEMANMAKNTIYYDAVAQQLGRYFSGLKSVINEGRR
ncbi:MAG TPA: flagellar basal body rod protein FlgB [Selenomonadales bacterium]|nr:flagellar basal body rod protein FlgB [Selenomonadales bacterium]